MYEIGRRVCIIAPGFGKHGQVGEITERNWGMRNGKRKAVYVVSYKEFTHRYSNSRVTFYGDYMCGSESLTPADFQCESCDRWCGDNQRHRMNIPVYGDDEGEHLDFCFLCARADISYPLTRHEEYLERTRMYAME